MIPTDGVILKTDKRGRVQTPAARRNEVLDEFEKSGLSGMKFAELAGVKYQTLATWVKKRRDQRRANATAGAVPSSPTVRRLETVVDAAAGRQDRAALILQLPGGVRLEVAEESQTALAAALVRALGKAC